MLSVFIENCVIFTMMSRPDFLSKQVFFIESNEFHKLKFKNTNLILIDENENIKLQHSCHKIFLIFVCGEFTITSVLIKSLKKHSIPVIFLNYNLKPFHSIIPNSKGNFLLHKKQYSCDNELEIAKHIITNKIINQISLMKSLRYKTQKEKNSIIICKEYLTKVKLAKTSQELLGIEGNVAKTYFETYFKNLDFLGRKPRCKTDIFNLLLDVGYFYLFNFIDANLELYDFDTYYGVYHKLFFQRKSLVCDLIEPFRCVIDRKIRKSYNLKQISDSDFGFKNGQYYIKREFNKKYAEIFLKEILKYKEDIFLYIQSYYRCFIKERSLSSYPVFYIKSDNDDNIDI